jgi:predicted NodU family carbamoyl transferase
VKILGVSDGIDAGAALAVDDRLVAAEAQSSFDGSARSRAFPWDAVADVLRRTGTRPEQVDVIAVAGLFSPPFFLRRRPGLRRVARSPFSSMLDLGVFYQAVLRETGMGALEAARAGDWLRARFAARGFRARVVLVDVHAALANAAYRSQPDDDVLIVTLQPMGDGVSLATHRGTAGQIDRVDEQRGFSSLHLHLARCAAAIGCSDARSMWAVAGPDADPDLLAALAQGLHAEQGRLSRRNHPLPEGRFVYEALKRVPREVAAASVHENLRQTVCALVEHHVRRAGIGSLAVAGEVFEDARLVADLAGVPGVTSVSCLADPGAGALAIGAAASLAGTRPTWFDPAGQDPELSDLVGDRFDPDAVADVLRARGSVTWSSGASGPASFRTAERCVLRLPRASAGWGTRALWLGSPAEGTAGARSLAYAMRAGAADVRVGAGFAERYPAALGPDGRAMVVPADPDSPVGEVLVRLVDRGEGGCLLVDALPERPARLAGLRSAAHRVGSALWVAGQRQVVP